MVLAGLSIFENQGYYLTSRLDDIAQGLNASNPNDIEFHASDIFARRSSPWNRLSKEEAQGVIKSVLRVVAESSASTYAFACAVHKESYTENAMNLAFEDLCQRFDIYLKHLFAEGERHKGLIILDESSHETSLQGLAKNFRQIGTQWGSIKHLAETPLFVDSRASRIIQLADHIAYAVFRRYNYGDTQYFDIIAHKFHQTDGVIHGLAHKQKVNPKCMCLGCSSRRARI